MKNTTPILLLTLCLGTASADTLRLKDGTQLKGKIVEETPEGVSIEYFVTATIKDQKTVSRADIESMEKISEDQVEFQTLGPLASPAQVLDTSFYDPLISRKIPEFIAKYPYSSHVAELRDRLNALSGERDRVKRGDRKIDSVWITADAIAADPYENGAMIAYAKMRTPLVSSNPVEYLRCYEMIEKQYPGSAVMPDAVDGALVQLAALQTRIAAARVNGEIALRNLSNAISASPADEAKQLRDGLERDNAAIKAAMKEASGDGRKFFPVSPNSKEALDALQAVAVAETARVTQLKKTPMRDGIAASTECRRLITQGNLKEAQAQLDLSRKLWPANIANERLKAQLDQAIKDEGEAARQKAQTSATPSPKQ
jgi:hypothetical protein